MTDLVIHKEVNRVEVAEEALVNSSLPYICTPPTQTHTLTHSK